jgi:hypothetical protein
MEESDGLYRVVESGESGWRRNITSLFDVTSFNSIIAQAFALPSSKWKTFNLRWKRNFEKEIHIKAYLRLHYKPNKGTSSKVCECPTHTFMLTLQEF